MQSFGQAPGPDRNGRLGYLPQDPGHALLLGGAYIHERPARLENSADGLCRPAFHDRILRVTQFASPYTFIYIRGQSPFWRRSCGADTRVCRVGTPADAWKIGHTALRGPSGSLGRFQLRRSRDRGCGLGCRFAASAIVSPKRRRAGEAVVIAKAEWETPHDKEPAGRTLRLGRDLATYCGSANATYT